MPENIKLQKPIAYPSEIGRRITTIFESHARYTYSSPAKQEASDLLHEMMAEIMTNGSAGGILVDMLLAYGNQCVRLMTQGDTE